jgi:hypothetical protein
LLLEVGFACWDYSIPSLEAYSEELLQFGDLENLTQVKQADTALRFDPTI